MTIVRFSSRGAAVALLVLGAISAQASAALSADRWVQRSATLTPDCAVKAKLPENGELGNGFKIESPLGLSIKNYVAPLKINFDCVSVTDPRVGRTVKRNSSSGLWEADYTSLFAELDQAQDRRWISKWFQRSFRVVQLKASNAIGYAIIDETSTEFGTIPSEANIGDQRSGPILLSFCLIRPPKAICGGGEIGNKKDRRSTDLTSTTLKIIESFEFVD